MTVLWVIENEQWPRAYIRGELIERGYDEVWGFPTLARALEAAERLAVHRPTLIVLDLFGLDFRPEELTAIAAMGSPILLLGGAAELAADAVRAIRWARVLKRPFTVGQVADAAVELLRP